MSLGSAMPVFMEARGLTREGRRPPCGQGVGVRFRQDPARQSQRTCGAVQRVRSFPGRPSGIARRSSGKGGGIRRRRVLLIAGETASHAEAHDGPRPLCALPAQTIRPSTSRNIPKTDE